ncbi:MAG: sugar phosphate nucleotidyltransferase [bacterium]
MKIQKAVVPIAGLGTRFYPASRACRKEFLPVIASDGIVRPLLHYQIIDLIDAGIDQICLVVNPGGEQAVLDYFRIADSRYQPYLKKHPTLMQEAEMMEKVIDRLSFAVQESQEGYGHAVYMSKQFANNDPVLVCLGDHLFRGKKESCYSQLIQAFCQCHGKSVSAVNRISEDELKSYGTIAGKRLESNPDLIAVSLIIEKPSIPIATQLLRVDGLEPNEFLGWFGMHILSPSIYAVLEEMIRHNVRQHNEFQLTYAQELLRQRDGYYAYEIKKGKRFDFGSPQDFAKNIAEYAKV